jgi:hypothetical protein
MSSNLDPLYLVVPPQGTVCPNGARIVERGRHVDGHTHRERVVIEKPFEVVLDDLRDGYVFEDYGPISFTLALVVDLAYVAHRPQERVMTFDTYCTVRPKPDHPHISGSQVCIGDNAAMWRRMFDHGTPAWRLIDEIGAMLSHYNDVSPYFTMKRDSDVDDDDEEDLPHCYACGDALSEGDVYTNDITDHVWCDTCYHERFTSCDRCDDPIRLSSGATTTVNVFSSRTNRTDEETWCESCTADDAVWCEDCNEYWSPACTEHEEEDEEK